MCSKLSHYQLQNRHKLFYINLMVITYKKQCTSTYTRFKKRNLSTYHRLIRSQRKRAKEEQRSYKTARRQLTKWQ